MSDDMSTKRLVVEAIIARHLAWRNVEHAGPVAAQLVAKWSAVRVAIVHAMATRPGEWVSTRELAALVESSFANTRSAWKSLAGIEIAASPDPVLVFRRGVEMRHRTPIVHNGVKVDGGVCLCLAGHKRMGWDQEVTITASTQGAVETGNANYNESTARQLSHPDAPAGAAEATRAAAARATGNTTGPQLKLLLTGTGGKGRPS